MTKFFTVQSHPNMGLMVKLKKQYSEADLRERCGSDKAKIARLKQLLKSPTVFRAVTGNKRKLPQKPASRKATIMPMLGANLRTFYINLAERDDRKIHIDKVCEDLGLKAERIDAIDGQKLAKKKYECIPGKADLKSTSAKQKTTSKVYKAKGKGKKVVGMKGLLHCTYKCSWWEKRQRKEQKMRMAPRRLQATKLTEEGHALWGAVGCSRSHQAVLRKVSRDKKNEWALVLEDDASFAKKLTPCEAQKIFKRGMRTICKKCPNWGLVYLGGVLASWPDKTTGKSTSWRSLTPKERLSKTVVKGKQLYQSHAYLIRKNIAQEILYRLREGRAADAALMDWCKANPSRCFMFHPRQLLRQPGGTARNKDGNITPESEQFMKAQGKAYAFAPKAGNKMIATARAKAGKACPNKVKQSLYFSAKRYAEAIKAKPSCSNKVKQSLYLAAKTYAKAVKAKSDAAAAAAKARTYYERAVAVAGGATKRLSACGLAQVKRATKALLPMKNCLKKLRAMKLMKVMKHK